MQVKNQETEWMSRNDLGRFPDYISHRYKFKNYPRLKRLEHFPLHLLIEPTSTCNLRCLMCFQCDPSFQRGFMDFGFFKSLVDQAVESGCQALTLASRGEPTLHPKFGEMLMYCKGKFLELKINTNATKLNENLCYQILDAGVDIVVFSVDSSYKEEYERIRVGGKFETVLGNIQQFVRLRQSRDRYRKTSTRVQGVDLGRQPVGEFQDFFSKIVDTVTFIDALPRWDTYHNEPVNYSTPCKLLWERMYVWFNGVCNPCDVDYRSGLSVGNAKEAPLKDIWLGEAYSKYRDLHLQGGRSSLFPCDRCNIF